MRVFVYEYTCAEAGEQMPASLRAEGWAMLSALLTDFRAVPGVEVTTLLHPSFAADCPGMEVVWASEEESETRFRTLAHSAHFTMVVAPESEGILETRARWVEEAGGRLLGPSVEAIRLTSDKLELARHWRCHGIPTPETWLLSAVPRCSTLLVCKPRDGAGSQATFKVHDSATLSDVPARARSEGYAGEMIVQPWIPGRPASVALIVGTQIQCLPAAAQDLSADGRFRYQGGVLPLRPHLTARAQRLAERAAGVVPGLRGYVGIDLILGEPADGSGDFAIELNPRLTTSYVGLRALSRTNLAELMLKAARGEVLQPPGYRDCLIRFSAAGVVTEENSCDSDISGTLSKGMD
jgi:predicted ATP-grasp superfamily ATP-dependent carboligase